MTPNTIPAAFPSHSVCQSLLERPWEEMELRLDSSSFQPALKAVKFLVLS